MTIRRIIAALLALTALAAAFPALAEDAEVSLEDVLGDSYVEEIPETDEGWLFPVALSDMEPELIILANKEMLIGKDFVVKPLVKMKERKAAKDGSNANGGVRKASGSKMELSQVCAEALVTMFEAANSDGIKLYLKSAYRSYQTQKTMYYNRLKKNKGRDDGWVMVPGGSDHQTGLGCDVVSYAWRDRAMNSDFAKTKEAQWMAAHCAEYGFIIRYPEDKTELTQVNYEPWHLRYVGIPAAAYITENGLCLEEFRVQLDGAIDEYIAMGGSEERVKPYIQVSAEEE